MSIESDRRNAIERAQKFASEQGALVLDTETTDLYGEVIELACIDLDGNQVYRSHFKPLGKIAPGAQAVHGYTLEMLADAPTWEQEYPKIRALLTSAPRVLIYNASFDIGRIEHTCRIHQCEPFKYQTACLMKLYAEWYGEWNDYRQDYKWQPLAGGHNALDDCLAALRRLYRMTERHDG